MIPAQSQKSFPSRPIFMGSCSSDLFSRSMIFNGIEKGKFLKKHFSGKAQAEVEERRGLKAEGAAISEGDLLPTPQKALWDGQRAGKKGDL